MKKGLASKTIDVDAKPVDKRIDYLSIEDKSLIPRSSIIKNFESVTESGQFGSGGHSNFKRNYKEQ